MRKYSDSFTEKGTLPAMPVHRATGMKRAVCLLLCWILVFGFAACSKPETPSPENTDPVGETERSSAPAGEETAAHTGTAAVTEKTYTPVDAEIKTDPVLYAMSAFPLTFLQDYSTKYHISMNFSEDRAWVTYKNFDGAPCAGIIDTNGVILREIDLKTLYEENKTTKALDYEIPEASAFSGGYSFFVPRYSSANLFYIFDRDGNLCFSSDDKDDKTTYKMYGGSDGYFLIYREVSSFSENTKKYAIIDAHGHILVSVSTSSNNPMSTAKYQYLGKGVFAVVFGNDWWIMNAVNGAAFNASDVKLSLRWEGFPKYYEDAVDRFFSLPEEGYVIHTAGYRLPYSAFDGAEAFAKQAEPLTAIERKDGPTFEISSDCLSVPGKSAYYSYDGTFTVPYPALPQGASVKYAYAFKDGLAPLKLSGADSKTYWTVIDKTGTMLYEPVPLNKSSPMDFADGYLFFTGDEVITPEGEVIPFNENYKTLPDIKISNGITKFFSEGWVHSLKFDKYFPSDANRFALIQKSTGKELQYAYNVA